ncbi:MAG TPA: hypothetical protein GXX65_01485 [Methanosarcina sp.]|jgi:hypothetical protein|nr:hypothetical protein [Methanosarcina sp.]
MGNTSVKNVSEEDTSVKDTSPLIVATAIVILIGLAIFIIYMLRHVSADDTEWTRYIYILTGVEAVGFAAAGYLFGKDVNRVRAEKAEARADSAQNIANDAQKRAVKAETKGNDLANFVRNKAETFNVGYEIESFGESFAQDTKINLDLESSLMKKPLDEMANFATMLFPKQND